MNPNPHNPMNSRSPSRDHSGPGEDTLRLIASLPAPEGFENRVHASLRNARQRGRVLAWPVVRRPHHGHWMRAAAAAAVVFVVAGGGWGVYTRIQHNQPAKVIAMPPRPPAAGSFSGAGAMRAPVTLPGPEAPQPGKASPAKPRAAKRPGAHLKSSTGSSAAPVGKTAESHAPVQ